MNKKRQLIAGVISFVIFIGGAAWLYNTLSSNYKEEQQNLKEKQEISLDDNDDIGDKEKTLAPDFTVYDEDGNKVKLSDYKGTPVILNFWASWCPPCREEMPYFNEASKDYKKEELAILMINLTDGKRETKETAQQYIKDNQYEAMHLLLDTDGDAAKAYQISGIPMTLFIDQEGYIIKGYNGAIEEDMLIDGINKLLKK